ncbi:MAG TPA: MBL fold metallo-hydrolase [Hyphomicrobiales bacterium]|nr:MBL fold metallo-hydrolase [Hyphomicrobiales bacterium]
MNAAQSRRHFLRQSAGTLGACAAASLAPRFAVAQEAPVAITQTDLGYAWLLQGAGCNAFVIPGQNEGGALLVDGGLAVHSDALLQAVYEVTGQDRVHTLINTHFHPEQTGSNEAVGAAGGVIIAHEKTAQCLRNGVLSANYAGRYGPLAQAGIPSQVLNGDGRMKFAGQEIIYGYLPAAHTNGDLFLYFPILDTLVAGGPVTMGEWPLPDIRQGAWLGGLVNGYEKLSQVVSADTVVIPAHGPVIDGTAVVRMRNMYSNFHLNMADELNLGMGWDDVVAKKPLAQHEAQYGDADVFVEAAFRSLQLAYVPD